MPKSPPPEAATAERARRIASNWLWVVELQCRRIGRSDPIDGEFLLRRFYDFQLLVVALFRFKRAVELAQRCPRLADRLRATLEQFDAALPDLKTLRNVAEHFDDYAMDKGRADTIRRQALEVAFVGNEAIHWLDSTLHTGEALKAARSAYESLKSAIRSATW